MIVTRGIKRHSIVPSVYLFFERDGKLLLLRRINTGYRDGDYGLPSGHIEEGETARLGGVREAQEEVGVKLNPADLTFVHVAHRQAEEREHERVDFYFRVEKWPGEPVNNELDKCDDIRWFDLDKLPKNIMPMVRETLEQIAKGDVYSEQFFS